MECPNCGETGASKEVFRCKDGHMFCERCFGSKFTEVLRIRIPICPKFLQDTFEGVGWTAVAGHIKLQAWALSRC